MLSNDIQTPFVTMISCNSRGPGYHQFKHQIQRFGTQIDEKRIRANISQVCKSPTLTRFDYYTRADKTLG